jgi:hypothetical protein
MMGKLGQKKIAVWAMGFAAVALYSCFVVRRSERQLEIILHDASLFTIQQNDATSSLSPLPSKTTTSTTTTTTTSDHDGTSSSSASRTTTTTNTSKPIRQSPEPTVQLFNGFESNNCSSPERYRIPLHSNSSMSSSSNGPAARPRIVFLTAKFGHAQKFKNDILHRRKEAIDTFEWLTDENAFAYYKFPEHWFLHQQHSSPNNNNDGDDDIDDDDNPSYGYSHQHTAFLKNPNDESAVGGGFWFWKPPLILDHLQELNNGDYLVYADYDQEIWWPCITDLLVYMMNDSNNTIDWALPRWLGGLEAAYTKHDVFQAYCTGHLDADQLQTAFFSAQWEAGIHIIKKSDRAVQLVQQWQRATEHYRAISDTPSLLTNHPEFQEHRRDQTLLNMMLKCWFPPAVVVQEAPHPCGWMYGENMIHFFFLQLPTTTMPVEEIAWLEEYRRDFWTSLNRYSWLNPIERRRRRRRRR